MEIEELKKELKVAGDTLILIKGKIDVAIQTLNLWKDAFTKSTLIYAEIDKKLALLDGRFKRIESGISHKKKEDLSKTLAKMSTKQKARLWEELKGRR